MQALDISDDEASTVPIKRADPLSSDSEDSLDSPPRKFKRLMPKVNSERKQPLVGVALEKEHRVIPVDYRKPCCPVAVETRPFYFSAEILPAVDRTGRVTIMEEYPLVMFETNLILVGMPFARALTSDDEMEPPCNAQEAIRDAQTTNTQLFQAVHARLKVTGAFVIQQYLLRRLRTAENTPLVLDGKPGIFMPNPSTLYMLQQLDAFHERVRQFAQ